MAEQGTDNPEAYLLTMQGQRLKNSSNREDWLKAAENFRSAIKLDPDFPEPYMCLAQLIANSVQFGGVQEHEAAVKELTGLAEQAAREVPSSGAEESVRYMLAKLVGDNVKLEKSLRALIKMGDPPARKYLGLEDLYAVLLLSGGLFIDRKQYAWYYFRRGRPVAEHPPFLWEDWNVRLWEHGAEAVLALEKPNVEMWLRRGDPVRIDVLNPLVTLSARQGDFDTARRNLSALAEADTSKLWYEHASLALRVYSGELVQDSAEYRALVARPDHNLTIGQIAFMLGDLETGAARFRQLNPFERAIFLQSRWGLEFHFPEPVREDPRYIAMLEEIGFGESWKRQLEAGVRELTPYTGLHLASDAPQKVVVGAWRVHF